MKTYRQVLLLACIFFVALQTKAACNWKSRIMQFSVTQNCSGNYKTLNCSVFLANTSGIQYSWSVLGSQINWSSSQSTYMYYPASNGTYLVQLYLKDNNNNCDTTITKQITFNCFKDCDWSSLPILADFEDSCKKDHSFIQNNSINCNLSTNGGTFGKFQTKWYINDTLKKTGGYNFTQILKKNGTYKMCVDIIDTVNKCDTSRCNTFNVTCINNCNFKAKNIYLYANDSCIQNKKNYFVKGAVLMNGTPDLSYRYQWYINSNPVGANYYSASTMVYSKTNYEVCVRITDTVKMCDTFICKTVFADCINCLPFKPQISNIVLSDSCYYMGTSPFRGVVGKLIFKNPAAANYYAVKWIVDSTLSSKSTYMRQAVTSKGFKKVCLTISDTLNGCDTQICRTVYVGCGFGSGLESQAMSNLTVYPNPASHLLSVPELREAYTFQCIDLTGKLVLSGAKSEGDHIDITSLIDGMYCLRIIAANRCYMARFVKQAN
jgi:hypothetical protein